MAKKKINGNLLNIQLVDVRPHYSFLTVARFSFAYQ